MCGGHVPGGYRMQEKCHALLNEPLDKQIASLKIILQQIHETNAIQNARINELEILLHRILEDREVQREEQQTLQNVNELELNDVELEESRSNAENH
uniref:SlyX protein n=1 Tax=Parastrongyloides trichosuri TaxID=131310 RepID=A0A0N5A3E7_PARTI